jgi:hypothetical protein
MIHGRVIIDLHCSSRGLGQWALTVFICSSKTAMSWQGSVSVEGKRSRYSIPILLVGLDAMAGDDKNTAGRGCVAWPFCVGCGFD